MSNARLLMTGVIFTSCGVALASSFPYGLICFGALCTIVGAFAALADWVDDG